MNVDIIKQTALNAILESNPINILYGTVTKVDPLTVKINEMLVLTSEFLVLDSIVELNEPVILIKYQNGQKYLVLSTISKTVDSDVALGGSTGNVGTVTDGVFNTGYSTSGTWKSLGTFKITHYCAEKYHHICNAGYPYKTCTGTDVRVGVVAVDKKVIPLGSYIKIDGVVYHAEDVGGAIKGKRIDRAVPTHAMAMSLGVMNKEVFLKVGG